jgi:hypothetical protein
MKSGSTPGNTPFFRCCWIAGDRCPSTKSRHAPWYTSLYLKLNDKTRQRDLHRLRELELAFLDTDNALWPGFVVPTNVKPPGKRESP